jgi:cell division septum initiation protein DivIVA
MNEACEAELTILRTEIRDLKKQIKELKEEMERKVDINDLLDAEKVTTGL